MYGNGNSGHQSRTNPAVSGTGTFSDQVKENENIYSNRTEPMRSERSPVNQITNDNTNIVALLREQLQLRIERRQEATSGAKPKLMAKSPEVMEQARHKQPFLPPQQPLRPKISPEKPMSSSEGIGSAGSPKMQQPQKYRLPPKPVNAFRIIPTPDEKPRDLPKPPSIPVCMGNLDLVAKHPPDMADDSDESEYEPMKEQMGKQQYQIPGSVQSPESMQALASSQSLMGSNESEIYHSPEVSDSEDTEEMYESIPERPDVDASCEKSDQFNLSTPLRPAPPRPSLPHNFKKPEKYSTMPKIASQLSRPLPPPPSIPEPERPVESPDWLHNIGRKEAEALIEGGNGGASSKSSTVPPDGYFLVRPSVKAKLTQPYTLVLWYKNKTYNIPVRRRPDSQYALGTVKPKELAFASLEEIVDYYKREELGLNSGSGDAQDGSTRLMQTPPKKKI